MEQPQTLAQWLAWQQQLHPANIELGLDRLAMVAARLPAKPANTHVITVAGTNGKGSCVRYLESMYRAAGYRTAAYTSPHLERYNERVRLDGNEVSDESLCYAFEHVETARQDILLTYFEFGTLAAFDIFWRAEPDIVLLEVGLGGRLDAVNSVDPDVAIITSIGLDHVNLLGPDRETIGHEKAGVFRPDTPAICADPVPPQSIYHTAKRVQAPLYCIGHQFGWQREEQGAHWQYYGPAGTLNTLPALAMHGDVQYDDAAAALTAIQCLESRRPVGEAAIRAGLVEAQLPSRFEVLEGRVKTILDVAHNREAVSAFAATLSAWRGEAPKGVVHIVLGMMADKPVEAVIDTLAAQANVWYLASLPPPRGLTATALAEHVQGRVADALLHTFDDAAAAWRHAYQQADGDDVIIALGSFVTASAVRAAWHAAQANALSYEERT